MNKKRVRAGKCSGAVDTGAVAVAQWNKIGKRKINNKKSSKRGNNKSFNLLYFVIYYGNVQQHAKEVIVFLD